VQAAQKQVALVTGAAGAIGSAIVEAIAGLPAWDAVPSTRATLDQGRPASIAAAGRGWSGPLHALVINASATPRLREETPEGVEMQWAVNVLGYHRLAAAFMERLAESARESGRPSRLVMVASSWAGGLDLDDPEFKRRGYDNDSAYRQSKQAERMLAAAWAEAAPRRRGRPLVLVNACHPGEVNSRLSNRLGFGGHESPAQGADTPVWLATSDEAAESTGAWFAYRRRGDCRFMADREGVAALWQLSESYGR
jgi:NAD(P)-dependent dehydrogenase (short-subunit alcohol dehydrogenase family)